MTLPKALKIFISLCIMQLIFISAFIFHGCVCNQPVIQYNLDSLCINNLNNSETFPIIPESNSMHSSAVAFSITLSDTNQYWPYYSSNVQRASLGYASAKATSMDCDPYFVANQKIVDVTIVTIYDLNAVILAGTNVTNLFLARSNSSYDGVMYSSFENLLTKLNSQSTNQPQVSFNVFLKPPIINTMAQFIFSVSLSDGNHLCDTTKLIAIIQNI
jgi:hypothetical protein